jgi:aryl-alcohol dehydrogenase-like predicted oxidoreductase
MGALMNTTRREFLKHTTLATAAATTLGSTLLETTMATAAPPQNWTTPATTKRGDMLYRKLGNTGEEVSLIGLGGFHIGKQKEESESLRLIAAAIDGGITFMDNCWDYNEGVSEVRMGKALKGKRDRVYLMSKIDGRTKKAAAQQIDESLLRLATDHIDLMQHHEIIRLEDPDRIFGNDGAHEAMLEAQKAGKIRHIGFTGHKDPIVHLRMLDIAAAHGVKFDSVQMPVNVMDAHFRSFTNDVLPRLVKEGIAPLAMKTFGDPFILQHVTKNGTATPIELLHYSMSLPVSVVITGIDNLKVLEQALEAARTFKPLTAAEQGTMLKKMSAAAADGHLERFKTSMQFDGTAQNPHWLG